MSAFLSDAWFASMNARLQEVSDAVPVSAHGAVRVVFRFSDATGAEDHALTFSVVDGRATLERGDHLAADVVIALTRDDAHQIARGSLHGGRALREGRLKVRGDVNAVSTFGAWIVAAQAATAPAAPGGDRSISQ